MMMMLIFALSMNFASSLNPDDNNTVVSKDVEDILKTDGNQVYVDPNYSGDSDGSKDSPYKDIQSALDNLDGNNSSTIILKDGNYTGKNNTGVTLLGNLTVKADDGAIPIINGNGANNYWTASNSNILLQGITFTNFSNINSNYGIITSFKADNLTVSECTFENNLNSRSLQLNEVNNTAVTDCTFTDNYHPYLNGGEVYIQNSNNFTFIRNLAENIYQQAAWARYGGVLYSNSNNNVTISENRFLNVTGGYGSGVYSYLDMQIKLQDNYFDTLGESDTYSGVVYVSTGDEVDIINNTVANTKSTGMYVNSNNGNVNLVDNDFINNSASSNGALYLSMSNSGYLTVKGNDFINNSGQYGGGARISLYNIDQGLIKDNNFYNNSATSYGGALYIYATVKNNLSVENNTFVNSSASGTGNVYGGAIYAETYGAIINNNSFFDSYASKYGGAIYVNSGVNNTISDNKFDGNTANTGGAVYLNSNLNNVVNNTFTNNNASDAGAIGIMGNSNVISGNIFSNNTAQDRGGVIYTNTASNTLVGNNTFDSNKAQIGGAVFFDYSQSYPNIYQNSNNTIVNSKFINNEAETGGAVVLYSSNSIVENCTFYNNNASRYGSGALASGGKNNLINNNTFENNTAFLYAGAIGTNDTTISNNIFKDNTAYQAGAILTINSTVINNTFEGNDANRGSNIVYLDNYEYPAVVCNCTNCTDCQCSEDNCNCTNASMTKVVKSLLINNTNLTEDSVYIYDEQTILNVVRDLKGTYFLYENDTISSGNYFYRAYCIEQDASIPVVGSIKYNGTWGILLDDLYFVRNSLDQSYVGDYIKVLIMMYTDTMYNLKDYIYIFTDSDYRHTRNPIIQNIIRTAEDSSTILINGNSWIGDTYYCCEFHSFINPTTRQNLILWNCCRDIVVPDLNPSKSASPSSSIKVGDNVTFTITVRNTKNIILHNVTVNENVPSNFEIVNWINTINDAWKRTGDTTWLLNRPLNPDETVTFQIVMRCKSAFSSNRNQIEVTSAETDAKSAYSWVYGDSSSGGLKITKTADSKNGVFEGDTVSFTIQVLNTGDSPRAPFSFDDYWYNNDYTYLTFYSSDTNWSVSKSNDNRLNLHYNGYLNSGTLSSIQLFFKITELSKTGYRYNYAYLDGQTVSDSYYVSYYNVLNVVKTGQNYAPVNTRISNYIYVYNGGHTNVGIENVWVEEIIPDGLIYDGWDENPNWVHTVNSNGVHRWTYIPILYNEQPGFYVYFKAAKSGNYTNNVISGGDNQPNRTASHLIQVEAGKVSIEKITVNETVDLGNQVAFIIKLKNTGVANSTEIYVTEYEFDGLVYDHFTDDGNWTQLDDGRFYYSGSLAVGASTNFTVYYNTTEPGKLTNRVSVTYDDDQGPNYAENTTFVRKPGMEVSKISLNPVTAAGANSTFAIIVKNTGNYELTNITVVEDDFTGLTFVGYQNVTGLWDLKQENGKYYFYLNGELDADEEAVFYVIFTSEVEGNFTNTVIANSTETPENLSANNSTQFANPDFEIQKISLNPEVWLCENATFTIIVKNTGNVNLTGLTIKENFSDLIENPTISEGSWSYDEDSCMFTLNEILAVNQTTSFNVTFTAKKSGTAVNTIEAYADETPFNKTADNTTFIKEADFEVEKILLYTDVEVGDTISYTIVVNNTGNVNLTSIVLVEKYPDALKFVSAGDGWTTEDNITFRYNSILEVNGTAELTLTFTVIGAGNVTNVVVVNSTETGNETRQANNTTYVIGPDFEVRKVALNATAEVGDNITFTIVVTNTGNANLSNVTVRENYPSSLEFVSFAGDWSTDDNVTFIYNNILGIENSTTLNITFKAKGEGNIVNIVDVTSNQTGELNKSANDTTYIKEHKFDVEKILLNETVNVGDTIVYTVVVTNTGSYDLTDITVSEKYPDALNFVSYSGDWSTDDNKTFIYDSSLDIGDSAVLNITFKVTQEGNVTNIVVVTSNETGDENKSANNTTFVRKPVFEVDKTAVDKEVLVGDNITFVITVTNTGNIDLTGIKVTEKYESDLQFLSFKGDWTTSDNKVFTLISTLSKGSSATLNITFKVLGTDNITNPVEVTSNENNTRVPSNDTIFSKNPQIKVDKITLNRTVYLGDKTVFLIVVSNVGNVDLDNITVIEDYSSELVLNSYSGKNWTRNGKIFTYGSILKPGESANFTVEFNTTKTGEFENNVVASSNNVSDTSSNETKVIHYYIPPVYSHNSNTNKNHGTAGVNNSTILLPVKSVKNRYHAPQKENAKSSKFNVPLSRHPTANPVDTLLLIVLLLSVISLIRVKSSLNFDKIGNKKFLFLVLLTVLVLMSAGCAMAADINQTDDGYVSEAYDEVVVLENAVIDDSVCEVVDSEVIAESVDDRGSGDIYQDSSDGSSTIYINPNAESSGDGSQESPYNTIQEALDNIDSGNENTLVLMDGIYKGDSNTNLDIPGNVLITASGNPTVDFENTAKSWNFEGSNVVLSGITFINAANSNAIINAAGNVNNYTIKSCTFKDNINSTLLNLSNVDDINIQGCTFTSNLATADGKYSIIADNANNITLQNNNVKYNSYATSGAFINANNAKDISIRNNEFDGIMSFGDGGVVYLNNASGGIVVYNNLFINPRTDGTGGFLYINAANTDEISISKNTFFGSAYTDTKEGQAIYLSSSNSNNISVIDNEFERLYSTDKGGAISILSSNDKFVNIEDNNFEYSRSGYGSSIYLSSAGSNVNLINNEFSNCFSTVTSSDASGAVDLRVENGKLVVKDNIFDNCYSYMARGSAASFNTNKGDVEIINNTFIGDSYDKTGDNVRLTSSNNDKVTVSDNEFIDCSSTYGSLYITSNYDKNTVVQNNRFVNSTASSSGGSLYINSQSNSRDISILDNEFYNSTSGAQGGSIYLYYTTTSSRNINIKNNIFENTTSTSNGGAIGIFGSNSYVYRPSDILNIEDNYIKNSSSHYGGGAIYLSETHFYGGSNKYNIINNTIIDSNATSGGAIRTYFNAANVVNDELTVERNTFTNTYASNGGAIYHVAQTSSNSQINTKIQNNTFINTTADNEGGSIYAINNNNARTIEINDNDFINASASKGGAIAIQGNNYNISGNEFNNTDAALYGGAIYSQKTSYDVFDNNNFTNNDAYMGGSIFIDYPQNYGVAARNQYNNTDIVISNSTFFNNSAETGGAVVVYTDNTVISYSTFTNNTATRYGSGAVVSGGKNSTIIDNLFEYNNAFLYAGAIGTNNSLITNNTFINNTAYQGGAILTINSTIEGNNFSGNNATRGIDIVSIDTPTLINNTISNDTVYYYNSSTILSIALELRNQYYLYENLTQTSGDYFYIGYCIEQNASVPLRNNGTYGILVDDLEFVRNSLDQSYVGDYIIVAFFISKLTDYYNIYEDVFTFTDTEYWKSNDTHIQYIISLTESGNIIITNNTITFNNTIYKFQTFINPTTRQNLIIINSSEEIILPKISVSKTTGTEYIKNGDTITYTITVTNDVRVPVHNLTVTDVVPAYLTVINWTNINNDTWIRVDNNTWNLNRTLKGFETVKFNVTCYCSNLATSATSVTNKVNAKVDELDEVSAEVSVPVAKSKISIDKSVVSVPKFSSGYVEGDVVMFKIRVYNTGQLESGTITVNDYWSGDNWEYVSFSSDDNMWYLSSNYNNDKTFTYKGNLEPGESSSFYVYLKAKINNKTDSRPNYARVYEDGSQKASDSEYVRVTTAPTFSISKSMPDNFPVGQYIPCTIRIYDVTGIIEDFTIEERFPENWEYMDTSGPSFMVHSQSQDGIHRWSFVRGQGPLYFSQATPLTITVLFRCNEPGNYTNTVIGGNSEIGYKNASDNITVVGTVLNIEKISNNQTVRLGNQVSFTIRVHNDGEFNWTNFDVKETPSGGLVYDHCIDNTGNWIYNNQTSVWRYNGTIVPDETVELELFFNTTAEGLATNDVQLNYGPLKYASNSTFIENYDLSVDKLAFDYNTKLGGNTTFAITVKNNGNMNLTGVFVEEDAIDGLTYLGHVNITGLWTIVQNGDKYIFKLNSTLAPGETAALDVIYRADEYGNHTNIVVVGSNETDENVTGNDTVFVGHPGASIGKLTVNKTVSVGEKVIFTIVVKNTGDIVLRGLTVKEIFPDELQYLSNNGNWIYDSKNNLFKSDRVLRVNETVSFNVTFLAVGEGNITNTVTLSSDDIDEISANNTTYIKNPQFSVEKVLLNQTVDVGDLITYSIIINNTGSENLTNVNITEIYPSVLEYVSISSGWTSEDNITFIYGGSIASGDTLLVNITFKALARGNATNIVAVNTDSGRKTANNTTVIKGYEFAVEKLAANQTVNIGDEVVFTITVNNTGDYDLESITLVENYPSSLKFVSVSGGWTTSDNKTFIYDGILEVNDHTVLNITFKAIINGNLTNTVDVNSSGYSSSDNDTVYVTESSFKVEKLLVSENISVGDNVVYTIVVINTGNVELTNVSVKENYPSALEFVSFEGSWTSDDNITFIFDDSLVSGDKAVLNITFNVLEAGEITNNVTVSTNETDNKTAENTTFVKVPGITVEKVLLNGTVVIGDTIVYTITVNNTGNIELTNVSVNEYYPDGLKFISVSDGWTTADNRTFIYNDALAAGDVVVLNITFKAVEAGEITNTVYVTTDESVSNVTSNTSVVRNPDFTVSKIAIDRVVLIGEDITFIIEVTNTGDINLTGIVVTEKYPDSLEFKSYVGEFTTSDNRTFTLNGTLTPDDSATLNITFKVLSRDNITNPIDVVCGNIARYDNDTIFVKDIQFTVEKITLNKTVKEGENVAFDIIITNTGNTDLTHIIVSENYPEQLVLMSFTGKDWIGNDEEFIYDDVLSPGNSTKLTVVFRANKTGEFTNMIDVNVDNVTGNASSSVKVTENDDATQNVTNGGNNTSTSAVKNSTSQNLKSSECVSNKLQQHATGNPLMLFALMLLTLILPLRRRK